MTGRVREFERGDAVWFKGAAVPYDAVDFRSLNPACAIHELLGEEVVYPDGVVFQAAVSSDGTGWWIPEDRLTLLPPWIDEPHPLGEIQRVFRDFCEEEEIMELAVSELHALRRERRGEAL